MKIVVVYTMEGCPYCTDIKEEFFKNSIPFVERDIAEHEEEYDDFVKVVKNEYVPSLMLLTLDKKDNAHDIQFLTPDRDYQDIYEGVTMVKKYLLK